MISTYDKESGQRYLKYIQSAEYHNLSGKLFRKLNAIKLNSLSESDKSRIKKRISLFKLSTPGHCAVCLDVIPSKKIDNNKILIYCCKSCENIGYILTKDKESNKNYGNK